MSEVPINRCFIYANMSVKYG